MEKSINNIIPEKLARKYNIVTFGFEGDKLIVGADNLSPQSVQEIKIATGKNVVFRKVDSSFINEKINNLYSRNDDEGDNDILLVLNDIIEKSVSLGASDIHMEPYDKYYRVRLRIDGELEEIMRSSIDEYRMLSTVVKLRSLMDITDIKSPQDGRFEHVYMNRTLDFRVSSVPVSNGDKIVMRVLNRESTFMDRRKIGFSDKANCMIDEMICKKSGLIIISGPTGSGKTTTMYSLINDVNSEGRNITTIEEPVEYRFDGINQISIGVNSSMTFENTLKAVLRQDPDVIVLGEIRDRETARIAVSAAMSGHLVITSLHTNDAVSSVIRLKDMGIEQYMINASLIGVISQRLVKKSVFDVENKSGRQIIYEIILNSREFGEKLKETLDYGELKKTAKKNGMIDFAECLDLIPSCADNEKILERL